MNYDMVKYERGQIWVIRFKQPEHVGHEVQKDRPWLILSLGKFNKASGMITAVPITTRDSIRSPAQVSFTNIRNVNNVILCEGIRSFDVTSGNYILDYLGTISDEILEQVDVALSVHLGLHYSPITLDKLYSSMEAIITSVGHMQQKADTPKFTDDDVIAFAEKLQSLAGSNSDEVSATIEETNTSEAEPEVVATPAPKKRASSPRIRWTPAKCKEFLADVESLPMKQVMDKWNVPTKNKYYYMKNYTKSLLLKMQQ